MSDLNEQFIKNLSRLCRIDLKNEEVPELVDTLKRVVSYFDQLKEVDVTHLVPYSHVEEQGVESLREDHPKDLLARDRFLANAPEHIGGMVKVPPLFKQN